MLRKSEAFYHRHCLPKRRLQIQINVNLLIMTINYFLFLFSILMIFLWVKLFGESLVERMKITSNNKVGHRSPTLLFDVIFISDLYNMWFAIRSDSRGFLFFLLTYIMNNNPWRVRQSCTHLMNTTTSVLCELHVKGFVIKYRLCLYINVYKLIISACTHNQSTYIRHTYRQVSGVVTFDSSARCYFVVLVCQHCQNVTHYRTSAHAHSYPS